MRSTLTRIGVAVAALAILLRVNQAIAQEPTPTDKIASCIENAWDSYENCIREHRWYWLWPCGWKLEADTILCLPKGISKM
jgi:negative regulator of sigma E activity